MFGNLTEPCSVKSGLCSLENANQFCYKMSMNWLKLKEVGVLRSSALTTMPLVWIPVNKSLILNMVLLLCMRMMLAFILILFFIQLPFSCKLCFLVILGSILLPE